MADSRTMAEQGPEVFETHISWVVMLGDRVYKVKKPVRTGFLDFSTVEARGRACRREVELNRRLAPDVYTGVATMHDEKDRVCEHVVVMRRMPDGRRLSSLVQQGADVEAGLRALAHQIASFHTHAARSPEIDRAGRRDVVASHWEDNFAELAPFAGDVLPADDMRRVEQLTRSYLGGRSPLFDARIEAGLVRDGHGDLQAEDIFCLEDGPRILDCIEFDERLRYGDVLADVAFLAMDLERLGAAAAAGRFLGYYREFAGENYPASLAHHYVAYRAQVRAKVACLRHDQGDPAAAVRAAEVLDLSLRHLEQGRVALVLVGGLPGTGKSALATAVADARGWSVLRSDEVRKDLAGIPHHRPARAAYKKGSTAQRSPRPLTAPSSTGPDELWRRASQWSSTPPGPTAAGGLPPPRSPQPRPASSSSCSAWPRRSWPPPG
jgi:aminoglycoside phosphotransferase family enzyme